jgi:hypothetical protein
VKGVAWQQTSSFQYLGIESGSERGATTKRPSSLDRCQKGCDCRTKPCCSCAQRARPDKQVLSLEERGESVRGSFATRSGSQVDNLRVLLVDDVLTTGATLDACARALREAGARSIVGLTVARALRNPLPDTRQW